MKSVPMPLFGPTVPRWCRSIFAIGVTGGLSFHHHVRNVGVQIGELVEAVGSVTVGPTGLPLKSVTGEPSRFSRLTVTPAIRFS